MKAIRVPPLNDTQRGELTKLYRSTKEPRQRTRAQMVLLSAEQGRKAPEIAAIVRESEVTVQRWLKRYLAEGLEGLKDAPRPGRAATVTETYRAELLAAVRRRPRSLELAYSLWTLQRPADYLAEKTGLRVSDETVRQTLKKALAWLQRVHGHVARMVQDKAVLAQFLVFQQLFAVPLLAFRRAIVPLHQGDVVLP